MFDSDWSSGYNLGAMVYEITGEVDRIGQPLRTCGSTSRGELPESESPSGSGSFFAHMPADSCQLDAGVPVVDVIAYLRDA